MYSKDAGRFKCTTVQGCRRFPIIPSTCTFVCVCVVLNKQDRFFFPELSSLLNFKIYSAAVEQIEKRVLKEQNLHSKVDGITTN